MRRIKWKLLMAPLGILTLFACSPNQYQQLTEYDDVYFTSADRQQTPKVIAKPVEVTPVANTQVVSLENSSIAKVEPELVQKYSSPTKEVTYFELTEPKVQRASELNYDDFVSDYENSLLKYYELPVDWETEWNEGEFNRLVRDDFYFAQAWYDQYYRGDGARMDEYLAGSLGRNNLSVSDLRSSNLGSDININLGLGFGRGWGWGSPFGWGNNFGWGVGFGWGDPFFGVNAGFWDPWAFRSPFGFRNAWAFNSWDPFWGSSWGWGGIGFNRWNRWNRWNRRAWRNGWIGGFNGPVVNNFFVGNSGEFVNGRGRTFTRGGRLRSTSVTSVRSDALNGTVASRRSGRVSATNDRITRSSISNVSSRSSRVSGGRAVSSSSARSGRVSSSRTGSANVRSSRSSSPNVSSARSSRVRTDAYRFSSSRNSRSSSVSTDRSASRASSSREVRSRTSRFSRDSFSSNRSSSNRSSSRNSGLSFSRNSSSRSSSGIRSSSRSSGSRSSYSRGSSSRGSSSRSFSRGSSSRSSSRGSFSRSSGGSRSSGSSRSSSSRSGGSSRSGRG